MMYFFTKKIIISLKKYKSLQLTKDVMDKNCKTYIL